MTREEAIKTLKGEAWICCAEKWNEALDMAIEALNTVDAVEEIKAECIRAVDRIPITFSKQDADNCLKRDIRDIFDKHIGKEQE